MTKLEEIKKEYENEYPGAAVVITPVSDDGPYIQYKVNLTFNTHRYNPKFDESNPVECACGHSYYRHFDSYENMAPVGCKYCGCRHYHVLPDGTSPHDRCTHLFKITHSQFEYNDMLEHYIMQWEMFSNKSFEDYFGVSVNNIFKPENVKYEDNQNYSYNDSSDEFIEVV